jgi:hypothetical protein
LYLSLIVYFIVSLMRLEAFALGALQMSYYYYYYLSSKLRVNSQLLQRRLQIHQTKLKFLAFDILCFS